MIHSIPNYPEFKENKEDYILDIDPSQLIYGQSIIILTFPYSDQKLNDIYTQLDVMNAHIYYNCTNYSKKKDSNLIRLIDIAECVQHISKHEKWGKDIFEHLSLSFDTVMLCETWCKPASPSTSLVKNVKTVRWNDQLSYSSTNDHSKYAVSMSEDKPYVFIGDINHMESQTRRGGGGVIIKNKSLWKAFHSIIQNYNDIIENPNYNNDENNNENNDNNENNENNDKKCLFLSCFGFCK